MASVGFGQHEARRKKWITVAVLGALSATLVTVALAYWWSRGRREKGLSVPPRLPADIHQQLSEYSFTRSLEGRRVFTIHAARTVAFKEGGTTVLEDVFVEVFGRAGKRHDILRTQRAEYNARSGDLFSAGKVEIELNVQLETPPQAATRGRYPVYLETSQVSFRQQGSLLVSDEPVRFRIGPASGTARGIAYATKDGWLELKKNIALEFVPQGRGQPRAPVQLSATRLRYEKESGEVRLWGPIDINQGSRRVTAEQGAVFLDDQNRVSQAVLEGGVRAFDSSQANPIEASAQRVRASFDPSDTELRQLLAQGDIRWESMRRGTTTRLEAQEFEMSFQGAHPQPQNGMASGEVRVTLLSWPVLKGENAVSAAPAAETKVLTTAQVHFNFRPGGRSLQVAETVGPGKLILLPAVPKVGERVITAGRFVVGFDTRSRPETVRGWSPTQIVFQPPQDAPPGSLPQETSAEQLEASFDPAMQTLRTVEQRGNFQFRQGDRQASADRARYVAQTQLLTLTGSPQVWDPNTRASAERMVIDAGSDTAEGFGKVQATHFRTAGPAEAGRPGEPTNVLADRMVARRQSQTIHYEGHVRVWHGRDVVEASALDVYRTERRVSSGSQVVTAHHQPAPLGSPGDSRQATRGESHPVTIRADRLDYLDEGRKASYRGNVELRTQDITFKADRMDVYFSSGRTVDAAEVEHAVAEGHVTVAQPRRRASGEHAEYFAAPGKIVVTGGPPTLYDAEKGFTTGQCLTFFIHDDRLFVDGGDESPTILRHRVAR